MWFLEYLEYACSEAVITGQHITVDEDRIKTLVKRKDWDGLTNAIYHMITTRVDWRENYDRLKAKHPNISSEYDKTVMTADHDNPSWAQWDVKPHRNRKESMKLYFSIGVDDVFAMLKGIGKLRDYLEPISDRFCESLSFKIPTTFSGFTGHNDSLVVHFTFTDEYLKNANSVMLAKDAVHNAVNGWAARQGITFSKRTHTFGQDSGGKSYGGRLASKISDWAKDNSFDYEKAGKTNYVDELTKRIVVKMNNTLADIKVLDR